MKFWIEFPQTAGQWAGRHWFATQKERQAFVIRHAKIGAPFAGVTLGKKGGFA